MISTMGTVRMSSFENILTIPIPYDPWVSIFPRERNISGPDRLYQSRLCFFESPVTWTLRCRFSPKPNRPTVGQTAMVWTGAIFDCPSRTRQDGWIDVVGNLSRLRRSITLVGLMECHSYRILNLIDVLNFMPAFYVWQTGFTRPIAREQYTRCREP
jgi:hypothetical protein